MARSESEARAQKKYASKFYNLQVRILEAERQKIKAHAESLGMSLNAYINKLIKDDMEK